MATTIKAQMSKFMAALAMAVIASMFCVGSAFASVDVSVTFPVSSSTTATKTVTLDQAGVQNSSAAPVVGMFYKSSAWNVLVTGTAANQYASWDSILTQAIKQYNEDTYGTTNTSNYITKTQVNGWATNQQLSLTATDGVYTKYYPNAADLKGDSTGSAYFYDLATNANTTLTSSLRSSTYALTSSLNGTNPNGVGPAFAWKYGQDAAGTITNADGSISYETAGDAAQYAADSTFTVASHPRLIMGCQDGWTTSTAMGKRYCTDITGITLS